MFGRKEYVDGQTVQTYFNIGERYMPSVSITKRGSTLELSFRYNKKLIEEVKVMSGARWNPDTKRWTINDNPRNHFNISYLEGMNVFAHYERPLLDFKPARKLFAHQIDLVRQIITYQYTILASEMGTGKTLACIEAMEWLRVNRDVKGWFYVAPNAAMKSVQLEFERWNALVLPEFLSYEQLKYMIENWPAGAKPPLGVILDESSRCKNPTAQRTVATQHLADGIREEWGDRGYVIEMSGTPAPNNPTDWYSQAEIACPGFLREGDMNKFKKRLAIVNLEESAVTGAKYPKLVAWLDDENKCKTCGKFETDAVHSPMATATGAGHVFEKSVNEVKKLYARMKGLVMVKFKKDCLDLPEKHYKEVVCSPPREMLNAAKLITAMGGPIIQVMTLLRELSDGFQYQNVEMGTETCPACKGVKYREDMVYDGPDEAFEKYQEMMLLGQELPPNIFKQVRSACLFCDGVGQSTKFVREAAVVETPKVAAFENLIDMHEEVGRLVAYAGFTGSVDLCVRSAIRKGWDYVRVDGRGWATSMTDCPDGKDMLRNFQYNKEKYPRLIFIGQAGAAGMGLNLTASPSIVYYSNDFNAESRIQSEDRIHRPGMCLTRGATIYDLICLPTDRRILEVIKKKRELQSMTLGDFKQALESIDVAT